MAIQDFVTGQVLTAAQMDALQANDYNQTVSAKVASYVLTAADKGTRVTMSNAGATTITVNTSLFTDGDTLFITNIGAGACTITAGTATVSTISSLVLAQYDSGTLYFTSTGVAIWQKFQGATAASSSGLTLIKRASFSGVANTGTTFDDIFTSTYTQYLIRIESLYAVTGTDDFNMQMRYAGPTTETGTNYRGSSVAFNYSAGAGVNTASPTSPAWLVATDIGETTYRGAGEFNFTGVGNSSEIPQFWGRYTGGIANVITYGNHDVARIYTGILLKSSSTNITGTLSVYGLAKA